MSSDVVTSGTCGYAPCDDDVPYWLIRPKSYNRPWVITLTVKNEYTYFESKFPFRPNTSRSIPRSALPLSIFLIAMNSQPGNDISHHRGAK